MSKPPLVTIILRIGDGVPFILIKLRLRCHNDQCNSVLEIEGVSIRQPTTQNRDA